MSALTLAAWNFMQLARLADAVSDKHHDILAFTMFDGAQARVANAGTVVEYPLVILEGAAPEDFALRSEHLAKLAPLVDPHGSVEIALTGAQAAIRSFDERAALVGAWTLPLATRTARASFPDAPSTDDATTWLDVATTNLAQTLNDVAPWVTDDGVVQITATGAVYAATWGSAVSTHFPEDAVAADTYPEPKLSLPGPAARLLAKTVPKSDQATISEGPQWIHVTTNLVTYHLAKRTEPADDVAQLYFNDEVGPTGVTVEVDQLQAALKRAGALSDAIVLRHSADALLIDAADGSSSQSVPGKPGSVWDDVLVSAKAMLAALGPVAAANDPREYVATAHVICPGPSPLVLITHRYTEVAIVPQVPL